MGLGEMVFLPKYRGRDTVSLGLKLLLQDWKEKDLKIKSKIFWIDLWVQYFPLQILKITSSIS